MFSEAFEDLGARVEAGEEAGIDEYAAEGPDEFFAVASEYFFELPEVLDGCYPEVYAALRAFYRQDPRESDRGGGWPMTGPIMPGGRCGGTTAPSRRGATIRGRRSRAGTTGLHSKPTRRFGEVRERRSARFRPRPAQRSSSSVSIDSGLTCRTSLPFTRKSTYSAMFFE